MLLISEDIIHRLGTMGRRGTLVNVFSFGWGKVVRMQDDDEWAPESGQHAEDEAVFACFKFWESRVYRGFLVWDYGGMYSLFDRRTQG